VAALGGLALCHAGLGDPVRAFDFARRAHAAAGRVYAADGRVIDGFALADSALFLAELHTGRGEFAAARALCLSALELQRRFARRTAIVDVQEALVVLDFREGRAAEALAALDPVLANRRTLRGRAKLIRTLLNRAEILSSLGRHADAGRDEEKDRASTDAIKSPRTLSAVYRRLAGLREAAGDTAGALAAARRYFAAELEVAGEVARLRAEELQARYDVAKKDEELARLARVNEVHAAESRAQEARLALNAAELRASAAELARTRLQRLALGAGIAGATVLFGVIVFVQRSRLRVERAALDETRRARAAAEEAAALKTQLLGIASHDLKAPLRAMLTRAHLLAATVGTEGAPGRALRGLRDEGERMLRLVHDLLDVSAIEQGSLTLTFGDVDLAALVAGVVDTHRPLAALKNLDLALEAPAVLPAPVRGDPDRLGQAIANLVDNAVKFTPPGKSVRVELRTESGHVSVAVRDEGPGVSAEDLARMFQPFQTASAVPTGGESSSGLGLHIAREIVARHGGRIDVDSAPWGGAVFTVVLPLAAPAVAAVARGV